MFKIFTRKKNQVDLLENPISPVIVNELGGIGELTFSVPSTYKHLELEGYIQVENDHEYVIKEIVTHGTNRDVVCMLNIEEILGMAWSKFISRDNTLMKCAELVLSGTKWRAIDKSSCKVKRNLYGTVTNSYNLLQMMCTVYNVEFIFDTYNKTVTFVDKVGKDAGVYFINDINLKQLNVDTHTHKYITRVIPIGKDGLTIESVNNGKNYLENKSYSDKNIYGIWQSDKHEDPNALKTDAKRFLDEMAVPYETYEVVVDDLYALKGYTDFQYGLGDIVTIIDGDTETRIQQRIIQRTYNLLEPDKDTIHIANKDATFEDYYKRLQTIADMTQSVIGSDGSINGGSISDGTISGDKIENDSINSDHISSGSITSTHIKAEQILADHIMSNQITTNHLVAESITSDHIQANTIDTKHLKANTITSNHIQSNTINSNHISANTITSGHIQSGAITAGSGIIADGAIGDAQIANLNAGKIKSGRLDTSLVTIQSGSGNMLMSDNTIQINDNKGTTRVQIGKDAHDDYNMYVCDANGQVMFDATGITDKGIKSPIIRDDMISEDAHINGAKIDIESVITKINDSETLIKTSKIAFDDTGQTLQVAFKELYDTVDQVDQDFTHFKNTELNILQGKISTLIQDTTIEKDGETYKIKDLYSSIEQTTEGIKTTVGKKVDKDSVISTINQSAEAVTIDASKINLRGVVTAESLAGNGTTTINGANITTGTIDTNRVNIKGGTTKKIVIANDNYCVYDGAETDVNRKVFMGFRTNTATNVPSVMLGYNGINPSVDGAVVNGGTYTTYSHYPNNNNPEGVNLSYGALAFKYGAQHYQFSTLNMYQNGDIDLKSGASMYFRPNLRAKDNHVFAITDTSVGCRVPFRCTSSIYTNGNISTDGGLNASSLDIPNVSINSNGIYTTGHITGGMVKTDSYRFTNNHIAFAKNAYNNNMMNGCNWDWQYCNLVNVKVYPVTLSLPTIDESTIQTVSKTHKDTLSQIKFPEARALSVEESAPSIDISDVTNKEEITTNGDVDLIKLVYLLVKDVQGLKTEVDSLKQENNELKLLLNKGE